jgi:RNA polymerase sigma-70 factor (ECF subfamily)
LPKLAPSALRFDKATARPSSGKLLPAVELAPTTEELELAIRGLCEKNDWSAATTAVLRGYGHEVFGYLVAIHHDTDQASEVFSIVSEQVFRGLPSFAWQCSCRAWVYTVARNASSRFWRGAARRAKRFVPLSSGHLSELEAQIRSETLSFLKTERAAAARALRASLSEEDQTLLILRVDRRLPWNELARVMLGEEPATAEALKRIAARLRKRYQLIKDKLSKQMKVEPARDTRRS